MNKRIRVGLCAYGMSGKLFQAPFFAHHPGFSLDYIVRRSTDEKIDLYPDTKILRDVENLVHSDEVDLIVVNTPIQTHFNYALKALSAGKHILVEKPFTVTSDEGEKLIRLARQNNLKITVFQNRRWDRDFLKTKDVLQSGILGPLHEATIRFDRYRIQASGKIHKEGNLPGAGALYDLGSHLIDQALCLFGKPEYIFADLMRLRPDVASDDYFEVHLYYPKMKVHLVSNVMSATTLPGYVFLGEKGSLIQQRSDQQEFLLGKGHIPSGQSWQPVLTNNDTSICLIENGKKHNYETMTNPGNYYLFFDELYKYLSDEGTNPVTPQDACETIKLIELAVRSDKIKTAVRIDA